MNLHNTRVNWLAILLLNVSLAVGWWFLYQKTVLSFQVAPTVVAVSKFRAELPTEVVIPSIGVNVPLQVSKITQGVWETSDTSASFLGESARPGEGGNIVMYAHNRPKLFGPLKKISTGDTIQVQVADGSTYEYRVDSTVIVKPEEVAAVLPTKKEVLTLYTCTGWMDSQRLVVQASPTHIISANR